MTADYTHYLPSFGHVLYLRDSLIASVICSVNPMKNRFKVTSCYTVLSDDCTRCVFHVTLTLVPFGQASLEMINQLSTLFLQVLQQHHPVELRMLYARLGKTSIFGFETPYHSPLLDCSHAHGGYLPPPTQCMHYAIT